MDFDYPNLQVAWDKISRSDPERALFKVPGEASGRQLSFRVGTFYKRALRFAIALQAELKLVAGDRVAILVEEPDDLAICLHGCFIGCFVAMPFSGELSTDQIIGLLNNCNAKCVVFSPATAARIAGMFDRTFAVKSWVVTSRGVSFSAGGLVRKLDELLAASAGSDLAVDSRTTEDCPGLVVLTEGTGGVQRGVSFSQAQIIAACKSAAQFHPSTEEGLARAYVPLRSMLGLVYSLITPLFTKSFSFATNDLELKSFWEKVQVEGATNLVLTQDQLRIITRRGKARTWAKPSNLSILLVSKSLLSSELLATFEKRFGVPIFPCYASTEAGGIVTAFPKDVSPEYAQTWLYDYYLPSSGIGLVGNDLRVADPEGKEVKPEVLGEILVRSAQVMTFYSGTQKGEAYFSQKSWLHTGDEGFYAVDANGAKHLFCTGRLADLIIRNNARVNPARLDNLLYNIEGVEFARAVGFPNLHVGHEIGAYVIPLKTAALTEQMILNKLREELDWPQCPKVIIIGKRSESGEAPSRQDLAQQFARYYDTDFSRPQ